MNRPLMQFMIVAAALPMMAAAQVPPARPAQPPVEAMPPIQPVQPKVRAMPAPKLADDFWYDSPMSLLKEQSMELMALQDELRLNEKAMQLQHKFEFKNELQMMHQQLAQLDVERLAFDASAMKMEADAFRYSMLELPAKGVLGGIGRGVGGGMGHGDMDRPLGGRPKAPWASEDPADSLYRLAREALNRGEYRRAAQVFNELVKKYPRSEYALHSQYWEAFARYRSGGTEDLKEAIRILDEGRVQFAGLRRDESNVDVDALRARVLAALAARGDSKAADELKKRLPQQANGSCDREEISVRAEARGIL